ncbi:MAG: DEAD/DEAH box helicase [Chloroflexota bacterium]
MTFDQFDLDPRLNAGIQAMGFTTPTPIQEQAIPHGLDGRDVLGLAQTGTGKTAAFLLPVLQRLTRGPLRRVRALIVAPTRELADQIYKQSLELSRKTKIRTIAIYGGVGKKPQIDALARGVEVVVACPGRLLDLHNDKHIDLSKVEVLILDEADRMFDMGFLPDIRRIIKRLPQKRQNLLFSATMPNDIRELADETLADPVTVKIGMIAPAKTVSHAIYPCLQKQKNKMIRALLQELSFGRLLIFTRTKYKARNLARDLDKKGFNVAALQGNMSQNQRVKAMEGFRKGKFDIMIATDIAARGIDVSDITHVINFDMPDTVDAYTHRIGRTGRAKQEGEAFTFATPDDVAMIRRIERLLKEPIELRQLEGFDYEGFDPANPWPKSNKSAGEHAQARRSKQRQKNQRRRPQGQNKSRARGKARKKPNPSRSKT